MRILALADIEPDVPIDLLAEIHGPDIVITLGDLPLDVLRQASALELPTFGVYGNHDAPGWLDRAGIIDLHQHTVLVKGMRIGGVEGCPWYEDAPFHYTNKEIKDKLKTMPPVDVLCAHAPMRGINDHPHHPPHQGFKALRSYIRKTQPQWFLHGHYNAHEPQDRLGATRIACVYGYSVIDL